MKKKILHIAYRSLANGGIQAVIMGIVRNLHDDYDFDVLLFSNKKGYYDDEFLKYGNIYRIPCDKRNNIIFNFFEKFSRPFKSFIGTYKILKKGNYDVVHCHNGIESGITLLAAKILGIPIRISHSHIASFTKDTSIITKVYKVTVKSLINYNSNIKIGCSNIANSYLFGEKVKDAIVIKNGIDLTKFNKYKEVEILNENSNINFIHIGRYSNEKNQLFLLEVFKKINDTIPNTTLTLVGFGELEKVVKKKILDLNINHCVNMLPHDTNIPKILSSSDYMIFPSKFEGLGIALIEAQIMGIKCFVSDTVTTESNLGLCSYISLKKSSKFWAKEICEHIKVNRNTKSLKSMENIIKEFDIKEIVKKYKSIYGQV